MAFCRKILSSFDQCSSLSSNRGIENSYCDGVRALTIRVFSFRAIPYSEMSTDPSNDAGSPRRPRLLVMTVWTKSVLARRLAADEAIQRNRFNEGRQSLFAPCTIIAGLPRRITSHENDRRNSAVATAAGGKQSGTFAAIVTGSPRPFGLVKTSLISIPSPARLKYVYSRRECKIG